MDISCQVFIGETHCCILDLFVPPHLRGRGLALIAIKDALKDATRHLDGKKYIVHVDDMSDRYRHANNIYLKCGFEYTEHGYPEMTVSLSTLQRTLRHLTRTPFF